MKIFISWSGDRSRLLAEALRDWLPLVLHFVKPWLSGADITAGDRWAQVVAKELEATNFGIICVTPENLSSPWVLFEAGALAKSLQDARVIPLLFNLEFSDISGPLAQFQAKKFDQNGINEVILSINQSADLTIPEDNAKQLLSALWPKLETKVSAIPKVASKERHTRSQHEILEELLSGVRAFDSRARDIEIALADQGPRLKKRRSRLTLPMVFEELSRMSSRSGDDPIALLMLAGMLREDLPWLYEIILETYRELRSPDLRSAHIAVNRLRRVLRDATRTSMLEEFSGGSKDHHLMMMELPFVLDHFLERLLDGRSRKSSDPEDNGQVNLS